MLFCESTFAATVTTFLSSGPALALGEPAHSPLGASVYKTSEYMSLAALPPVNEAWKVIVVDCLEEVQDLLEALEEASFSDRQLLVLDKQRFAVAWK